MKKVELIYCYLPLCFYVFLAIYICIKFLLIFFLSANYEPEVIFNLTPYYLLSGVNKLQSLFLSIIIVFFNIYLHDNVNKKNLTYSFIPTGIILCGIGIKILSTDINISNIFHFIFFGILLLILIVDHKHFLIFSDSISGAKNESIQSNFSLTRLFIKRVESKHPYNPIVDKSFLKKDYKAKYEDNNKVLFKFGKIIKNDLVRVEKMMDELKIKTEKIRNLGEEIEKRRKKLTEHEKTFRKHVGSIKNSIKSEKTNHKLFDHKNKINSDQKIILDDIQDSAAIIMRGILKNVNQSFIDLIGYNFKEIIEKNLIDFIDSNGLLEIEKYYINILKGDYEHSYKTIFITKNNNKIPVEIQIKPTSFKGKKAELVVIKNL
jgi:PAS domain S-box-containing protein